MPGATESTRIHLCMQRPFMADFQGCVQQLVEEAKDNRTIREDNKNSVTLSTVHQSKGLEFTRVFIVRCSKPSTLSPKPQTLDPRPQTPDPKHWIIDPRPRELNLKTLDSRPLTLDP